ncbi:MAG: hypothetical protein HY329_14630 [Chloroflexi bacterium]|nr:hypothetical protein [Chloroflexota bacterium]
MSQPADDARSLTIAEFMDHLRRHGLEFGYLDPVEYGESARQTIRDGIRFTFRHESGDDRVGYFNPANDHFTSLSDDESVIFTHFITNETYVRSRQSSTYP